MTGRQPLGRNPCRAGARHARRSATHVVRDHVADPGEPRPRHDGPRPPSRPDRPGGSRHARDPAGPARRGAPAGSPEPRRCRRPSTAGVGARRRAPEVRHGAPGRRRRRRAAQLGPTHRSRPRRPRGRDSAPDPRSGRPWVGAEGATPKTAAPTPHPIPPGAGCAPGTPRRVATRRADVRRQRAQARHAVRCPARVARHRTRPRPSGKSRRARGSSAARTGPAARSLPARGKPSHDRWHAAGCAEPTPNPPGDAGAPKNSGKKGTQPRLDATRPSAGGRFR